MSPRALELGRRGGRWLVPGAVLALAPKCVLCVAGYLGLGTVLGWRSVELCGAEDHGSAVVLWGLLGMAVVTVTLLGMRWRRKKGSPRVG